MIAAVVSPMPGILIEPGGRVTERDQVFTDLGVDGGDVGVDGVDAGQHPGQQEPVMLIEGAWLKPGERLLQERNLGPHPEAGQMGRGCQIVCLGREALLVRVEVEAFAVCLSQ
jgi:hypothetical protein